VVGISAKGPAAARRRTQGPATVILAVNGEKDLKPKRSSTENSGRSDPRVVDVAAHRPTTKAFHVRTWSWPQPTRNQTAQGRRGLPLTQGARDDERGPLVDDIVAVLPPVAAIARSPSVFIARHLNPPPIRCCHGSRRHAGSRRCRAVRPAGWLIGRTSSRICARRPLVTASDAALAAFEGLGGAVQHGNGDLVAGVFRAPAFTLPARRSDC